MNTSMKYGMTFLLGVLLSTAAAASPPSNYCEWLKSPWAITASLGMEKYEHMDENQGQTAMGRFAINYAVTRYFGLEAGIQTGNQMRFDLPQESRDILGGLSVVGTIKPQLDMLFTARTPQVSLMNPLYAKVKGGIVYRQLQMDRESINDKDEFAPEFQVGLGYEINNRLDVSLMYQYIAGTNSTIQVDVLSETARIGHIPTQSALMFGLTFTLE